MGKLVHPAAPAALLALSAAAAAEPQRLDEGRLAGVAAGQELVAPSLTVTDLQSVTSITDVSSSNSVTNVADQALNGLAANHNYATAIGAQNVTATGNATTSVTGMIGNLAGIAGVPGGQ